jgi:hypothetical protein
VEDGSGKNVCECDNNYFLKYFLFKNILNNYFLFLKIIFNINSLK